ncbi:MAG TPA: hypothetical protein VIM58_01980 [Candidatus Methylacidiphilales bacterium]
MPRPVPLLLTLLISVSAARAELYEIPAKESPWPPSSVSLKKTPAAVLADFDKDQAAAMADYTDKPIHLTGKIADFTDSHPLNSEHDLFIVLAPGKNGGRPPSHELYVRLVRSQFKHLGFPADLKPNLSSLLRFYPNYTRTMDTLHTEAYYDVDRNGIDVFYSEELVPPKSAKKPSVPLTHDKIPLVSVGDPIEVDAEFERVVEDKTVIFDALIEP